MKRIYYLFTLLLMLSACQKEALDVPDGVNSPTDGNEVVPVLKGHVRVKFKEEALPRLNVVKTRSGVASGLSAVDLAGVDLSVYRMERVFPPAGKFEERHREAGLHLWYDIYFDEKVSTRSAVEAYGALPEIDHVETVPEARLCDYRVISEPLEPLQSLLQRTRATGDESEELPFDDPRLSEMWHYRNAGEKVNGLSGALEGADIGLFEAWKTETGSKDVIVAVMDGGIQFNHPDLAANMWINEAELNGKEGVDDDGNGYVDDVYGWNFVTGKKVTNEDGTSLFKNGAVTQYDHGTHCAGTISGVNGNGVGISGIAGGSGKGDGVRLMSCQIFHNDPATGESKAYADPNMYVYAADMGAVISSNSWTNGTGEEAAFLNSTMRSSIDYFIKYAGKDVSTRLQNGPMDGGLVVFAAANSNSDAKEWPASYSQNLRVAAMAHNFKRASYSNYGTWIDITAPGGEQSYGDPYAILSTVTNSGYAWYQGTSMACPHVAGCAALVLSKFQGKGYTPDDLRARLLNATHNIDGYNPKFKGLLGVGCVDVGMALTPPSQDPPEASPLTVVAAYDGWAIVEWEVKAAPDGPMNQYVLSWKSSPFQLTEAGDPDELQTKTVNVRYVAAGTILRDTIRGLEIGKTYYFTIQAFDRWGGMSESAPLVDRQVVVNQPPVLIPGWSSLVLMDEGAESVLSLKVSEPEKQNITYTLTPALSWAKVVNTGDSLLTIQLNPDYKAAGKYALRVGVVDQYGKAGQTNVDIEVIYKEVAPRIVRTLGNVALAKGARRYTIDLSEYFTDPKGRPMMYEVENSAGSVASVQRNGDQLFLEPKMAGRTDVLVRALNVTGLSVSQRFTLEVTHADTEDTANALSAYPNPVKKELNITLQPSVRGEVTLKLYNAAGRLMTIQSVTIGDNGYRLDMGSMQAGTYVLVVEGKTATWKKNIIKI